MAMTELASALRNWGTVELGSRASAGHVNDVWFAAVDGEECVVRRSRTRGPSLRWELELLDHVRSLGLGVPDIALTEDGRREVNGIVIFRKVEGRPPAGEDDWKAVADYLVTLHQESQSPEQRPGFLSSSDLLHEEIGGDVDLTAMPPDAVARCRSAWARINELPHSVVHGDPGKDNVLLTDRGVVLIDWDESRLDVPWFDLAALPAGLAPLTEEQWWTAQQAAHAWEAAVSWSSDNDYARWRLSQVET